MMKTVRMGVPVLLAFLLAFSSTAAAEEILGDAAAMVETVASESGLPVYEVSSFVETVLHEPVLVAVPGDWGNNASGRALTSYSPVNDSGAISPAAGTLTLSYFPMEGTDVRTAFDSYEKDIASLSMTEGMSSEDVQTTNFTARRLDFVMNVGANQFTCETVCFAHEQMLYVIELMQGQQTAYDYFPAYHQVVNSAKVGSDEEISGAAAPADGNPSLAPQTEQTVQTEPAPQTEQTVQTEPVPQTEQTEQTVQTEPGVPAGSSLPADIGTFMYEINGQAYQFPTPVSDLAEDALPLDRQLTLPYDFSNDGDMAGGRWTEIVNTQYYYFENAMHKEMAGVTNMSGYPVTLSEGMLTALVDTQGDYARVTLPGGIQVGSAESEILRGFPEFAGMAMDGTASFRGNELLYACNVRDDGCNGYVLIRNDAPYYSAVSIICENGAVREISFECLGSVRAEGVFL